MNIFDHKSQKLPQEDDNYALKLLRYENNE